MSFESGAPVVFLIIIKNLPEDPCNVGEDKRGKEVEEGRKRMNRKVSEEDVGSGERRGI